MKRTSLALAVLAIGGLAAVLPATAASADPGPETCRQGYVWREARASDLVCVTPQTRDQTARDNGLKGLRWVDGAYGKHTCRKGYVWREAFAGDVVCVTPEVRRQAAADNRDNADRKVLAKLWISTYTADYATRLKLNGDHYNVGKVRLVIKYNNDRVWLARTVEATPHMGFGGGGSFGYPTGKPACAPGTPANGYAFAYDVVSGRSSARVPVAIGCKTL